MTSMLLTCGPPLEWHWFRHTLRSWVRANHVNYVFQKNNLNCFRRAQCPAANVSSTQIQGDADYFINHLGVPSVQFAYEDIKSLQVIITKICNPLPPHTHTQCSRRAEFDFSLPIYLFYQGGHSKKLLHLELFLLFGGFVTVFENISSFQ